MEEGKGRKGVNVFDERVLLLLFILGLFSLVFKGLKSERERDFRY